MLRRSLSLLVVLAIAGAAAADQADRIYELKLVSEASPDLTSVEDFLAQAITPGMTDEQKCMAVWEMVYLNRFWNPSSRQSLRLWLGGSEPIANIHCSAATICQEDAEIAIAYWGLLGYSTRMWQLGWHTSPEVYYGDRWRHFDPTLGVITRDEFGEVDSITTRTDYWRPEHYGNVYPWMGPSAYVSSSEPYVLGHSMGLMLRPGESVKRYWYPLGTSREYYSPGTNGLRPSDRGPTDGYDESYLEMAMDLADWSFQILPYEAAYANGEWTWQVGLASPSWRGQFESADNLDVSTGEDGKPFLHATDVNQPAEAILRIRDPYVLTGGWLSAQVRCEDAGEVSVAVSTDCGNTWQGVYSTSAAGSEQIDIPLVDEINSKFEFLVSISISPGAQPEDVGVGEIGFQIIHQNSPFPLPALRLGDNAISVSAGPQLDRETIIAPLESGEYRDYMAYEHNVVTAREAGQSSWVTGICAQHSGDESYVVFRVDTPGDMRRLVCGGQFRDDNTDNKMFYSLDGTNWTEMPFTYDQAVEDTANTDRQWVAMYETLVPPAGTRTVWVKYWFYRAAGLSGYMLQLMTGLSIDAWHDPVGADGDLPPVDVTYCWSEFSGGQEQVRTDTHTVAGYPDTYNITVGGDATPMMKWVEVSRPAEATPWPAVNAGGDQAIVMPADTVDLHGVVTDDGLPNPPGAVATLWTASGPGEVAFGDASALDTTATFGAPGAYVLRLTADDGDYTAWDELTVTVSPPDVLNGLFARYPFDVDGQDIVGGNDGALVADATVVSDPERGGVLRLDGDGDYVNLPAQSLAAGESELTLTMWLKPDQWSDETTVYDEFGGNWDEYWQFSVLGSGWYTRDSSTGEMGPRDNDLAIPSITPGQWQHLALVYSVSEGVKAVYLDGGLAAWTTDSVETLTTGRAAARIGYPCDGDYFDGCIDDVRFYGRALGDDEISLLAGSLYQLVVSGGQGGGLYPPGQAVPIVADAPASGQRFVAWTGDTDALADPSVPSTTVTMPAAFCQVAATYAQVLPADLNGDGFVGQADLDIVLGRWGWTVDPGDAADPSGDGFVGQADLDIVLGGWGQGTRPQ
jgi:hypothetical protein